jgi:hypothetical protein
MPPNGEVVLRIRTINTKYNTRSVRVCQDAAILEAIRCGLPLVCGTGETEVDTSQRRLRSPEISFWIERTSGTALGRSLAIHLMYMHRPSNVLPAPPISLLHFGKCLTTRGMKPNNQLARAMHSEVNGAARP